MKSTKASITKTNVAYVTANLKPSNEQLPSVQEFADNRFLNFADQHNSAIICGSTYSSNNNKNVDSVLDAASAHFIQDKDGVIIGVSLTTGDGLGHSTEDRANLSTAKVTAIACEEFNKTVSEQITTGNFSSLNLANVFKNIANLSWQQREATISKDQYYDSVSAMTATIITNQDGSPKGKARSTGDVTYVVLNNKCEVVSTLAARVHSNKYADVYTPYSLQENLRESDLDHVPDNLKAIESNFSCNEGDIVIQLTDGMYSALANKTEITDATKEWPGRTKPEHKYLYKDTVILQKAFEELLKSELENYPYVSSIAIALRIAGKVFKASLKKQENITLLFQELVENKIDIEVLSDSRKEGEKLSSWLSKLPIKTKSIIENFIHLSSHDGNSYNENSPVSIFMQDLIKIKNGQGFGDCATINVMRVPYYKDELVRAYINYPENKERLLERIKFALDVSDLPEIEKRLKQEIFISRENEKSPGFRYKKIVYQSIYQPNDIKIFFSQLFHVLNNKLINEFEIKASKNLKTLKSLISKDISYLFNKKKKTANVTTIDSLISHKLYNWEALIDFLGAVLLFRIELQKEKRSDNLIKFLNENIIAITIKNIATHLSKDNITKHYKDIEEIETWGKQGRPISDLNEKQINAKKLVLGILEKEIFLESHITQNSSKKILQDLSRINQYLLRKPYNADNPEKILSERINSEPSLKQYFDLKILEANLVLLDKENKTNKNSNSSPQFELAFSQKMQLEKNMEKLTTTSEAKNLIDKNQSWLDKYIKSKILSDPKIKHLHFQESFELFLAAEIDEMNEIRLFTLQMPTVISDDNSAKPVALTDKEIEERLNSLKEIVEKIRAEAIKSDMQTLKVANSNLPGIEEKIVPENPNITEDQLQARLDHLDFNPGNK